jgi:hypothetical protein
MPVDKASHSSKLAGTSCIEYGADDAFAPKKFKKEK